MTNEEKIAQLRECLKKLESGDESLVPPWSNLLSSTVEVRHRISVLDGSFVMELKERMEDAQKAAYEAECNFLLAAGYNHSDDSDPEWNPPGDNEWEMDHEYALKHALVTFK